MNKDNILSVCGVVIFIVAASGWVGIIYIAAHFITKLW
jgi:hypothetical protein